MAQPPSSGHSSQYRKGAVASASDGRLFSPAYERNGPPIVAALTPWLAARTGPVLEIGAGTGQHATALALAFPRLDWWPSDPDPQHRCSISAWRTHLRLPSRVPLDLDAAGDWPDIAAVAVLGGLSAVIAMNVIHIAPFAVARGIVAGADRALAPGGLLVFYGPFRIAGAHIGEGNAAFDRGLRADNPDWGVRDTTEIEALISTTGLQFAACQPMPANNRLLIFRKPA
jgi:SAM-dependent methyltransferase